MSSEKSSSWFKNALGAVKDQAAQSLENARNVDNTATAASMGAGAMMGMSMHAVQLPERPAQVPAPARSIEEVAAQLPPLDVVSSVQMNAATRGWDAGGEVVFGDADLAGFALRRVHDSGAVAAVTVASMVGGNTIASIAASLTLYSKDGHELMTLECGHLTSQATLAHGEVIATLKRSTASKRYTLTGVGPLAGCELRGEPRFRVVKFRNSAARLRAQRASRGVEQWHPWVDTGGAIVADAREISGGPMPMAQITVSNQVDDRTRVLAWAGILDYWYSLAR